MQVVKLPARAGWRWVVEGFRLLRRQPLALLGLMVLFVLAIALSALVPIAGLVLPLVLMPLLSFGLMCAFRVVERGERPTAALLVAGARESHRRSRAPLAALGIVNALVTTVALLLTLPVDDGALARLLLGTAQPTDPALAQAPLGLAALVFMTVYAPLQMALWYAPMFVVWHDVDARRSLFYSFVAVWRNRGAFLVFSLGWLLVAAGASLALQLLISVIGGGAGVAGLALGPLSLVMLAAIYGSVWASYRDPIRDERTAPLAARP